MTFPTKIIEQHDLPASNLGNARTIKVIRYGDRQRDQKAYLQAGLHADEPPGFVVMHHLIDMLDRADSAGKIKGEIVLVPVANPIGISQWQDETLLGRLESGNGVNLNRNHLDIAMRVADRVKDKLGKKPENNKRLIRKTMGKVISTIKPRDESDELKRSLLSLAYDADIVLDLHCDFRSLMHIYLGTPLWPDASDLSAQMGAHATLLSSASGGNPFDEACSRIWWDLAEKFPKHPIPMACLAATVELRGTTDVSHDLGRKDAKNIFRFLQRRGLIKGSAPKLPPLLNKATPLRGMDYIRAPSPGIVVFLKEIGQSIQKDETVLEIVNPLEMGVKKRVMKVKSRINGILIATTLDRYARPGRILARVAGKKPLKEKKDHLLSD